MTQQEIDHINNNNHCYTFVIAQPFCNLDLLLSLYSITGESGIIGQQPISFYKSLINIHNGVDKDSVYGNPKKLLSDGISLNKYNSDNIEMFSRSRNYHIKQMLLPSRGPCKMIAMKNIGFDNTILVDFVNMIREIFDDSASTPFQIVFLKTSLEKAYEHYKEKGIHADFLMNNFQGQQEQMSEAYELGDVTIFGDDLINNPFETLLKCKPYLYPNKEKVMEISGMFK